MIISIFSNGISSHNFEFETFFKYQTFSVAEKIKSKNLTQKLDQIKIFIARKKKSQEIKICY